MKQSKEKIYVNFETITNSSEVIIKLLNEKYNINPPKTIKDLKDLTYKSIYRNLDGKDIENIKKSKEYYTNLKINKDFVELYESTKHIYEWEIILDRQYQEPEYTISITVWILTYLGDIMITNLYQPINQINFKGTHIDFNYNNFNFNSSCNKILLTQLLDTKYNYLKGGEEYTYQVHTWNDIKYIIEFFTNNKGW